MSLLPKFSIENLPKISSHFFHAPNNNVSILVRREQFYLQLKEDISAGRLRFPSESAHSVLSYVLQGKMPKKKPTFRESETPILQTHLASVAFTSTLI